LRRGVLLYRNGLSSTLKRTVEFLSGEIIIDLRP